MRQKKLFLIKRVLGLMLIISIIQISFDYTLFKIYANEVFYEQKLKEYCEGNPLDGYLFMQGQKDTGKLDAKIEAELNAQGIFDSEILNMSEEDIECIETSDKIYIMTQYVQYKYTGKDISINEDEKTKCIKNKKAIKKEHIQISETQEILNDFLNINCMEESSLPNGYEAKIMSEHEVDELIEELYFDEKSNNVDNLLDKILVSIGIKPQMVYAKTKVGSDRQNSSYMKKILMVCQVNDKVRINFNCIWIKQPANTLLDYVELQWAGGTRVFDDINHSYSAEMTYNKTTIDKSGNIVSKNKIVKDYTNNFKKNWQPNTVAVAYDLPEHYEFIYRYNKDLIAINTDIQLSVCFWLDKNGNTIDVLADYMHQKKKFYFDIYSATGSIISAATFIYSPFPSKFANTSFIVNTTFYILFISK